MKNKELCSFEDVYHFFTNSFKKTKLVGVEHEKSLFDCNFDIPKRLSFEQLKEIMLEFEQSGWNWSPRYEFHNRIELIKDNESLSLEAGGQLEYSGKPCESIHEVANFLQNNINQTKDIILEKNYIISSLGFDPITRLSELPRIPKKRYDYMEANLDQFAGRTMLRGATAIQSSYDYSCEEDLIKKITVAVTFQPILAILFASSPLCEGKKTAYHSYRNHLWSKVEPMRSGAPFAKKNPQTLESYLNYYLNQPMFFLINSSQYVTCHGETFMDFINGKCNFTHKKYPTVSDLECFFSTIYPDVRLKKVIELRGNDNCPLELLNASSALWTGIFYDDDVLDQVYQMACEIDYETFINWRVKACELGFNLTFKNRRISDLIKTIVDLASMGLQKRSLFNKSGINEAFYLSPLFSILDEQKTTSDHVNENFSQMNLTSLIKKWVY